MYFEEELSTKWNAQKHNTISDENMHINNKVSDTNVFIGPLFERLMGSQLMANYAYFSPFKKINGDDISRNI